MSKNKLPKNAVRTEIEHKVQKSNLRKPECSKLNKANSKWSSKSSSGSSILCEPLPKNAVRTEIAHKVQKSNLRKPECSKLNKASSKWSSKSSSSGSSILCEPLPKNAVRTEIAHKVQKSNLRKPECSKLNKASSKWSSKSSSTSSILSKPIALEKKNQIYKSCKIFRLINTTKAIKIGKKTKTKMQICKSCNVYHVIDNVISIKVGKKPKKNTQMSKPCKIYHVTDSVKSMKVNDACKPSSKQDHKNSHLSKSKTSVKIPIYNKQPCAPTKSGKKLSVPDLNQPGRSKSNLRQNPTGKPKLYKSTKQDHEDSRLSRVNTLEHSKQCQPKRILSKPIESNKKNEIIKPSIIFDVTDVSKSIKINDACTKPSNEVQEPNQEIQEEDKKIDLSRVKSSIDNMQPWAPARLGKKLLVLDLDETVCDFSKNPKAEPRPDERRPYLTEFLNSVYEYYDIVIWSATDKAVILKKIHRLKLFSAFSKLLFCLDLSVMTNVRIRVKNVLKQALVKPLETVWIKAPQYCSTNTLMIDDRSINFINNPKNGLQIQAYSSSNFSTDKELILLTKYLVDLAINCSDFSLVDHKNWKSYTPDL